MSQPFLGEIRMFGGNYAPAQWAFCNGQLLSISQYDALFSLLGTSYGGDGQTTFALPDLQCRIPVGQGQGPNLTNRNLGEKAGSETVTLDTTMLPSHSHSLTASTSNAGSPNVTGNVPANTSTQAGSHFYTIPKAGDNPPAVKELATGAATKTGGNQLHDNMMPSLVVSFIIALFGIYPSRN